MPVTSASVEHSHISPRRVRAMSFDSASVERYRSLARIGIDFPEPTVREMAAAFASDELSGSTLPGSIGAPIQFLQAWMPGFVHVMTQPRTADLLMGVTTIGSWEDEEIVQPVLEHASPVALYGDHTNIPLAGVGNGYERRTIIRWEAGLRVGSLEEKRAGKASINLAAEKRAAAALSLDIIRNRVGFYGFNAGANRTYGFLNDPGLPAYVAVAGGTWSTKTFLQITADIRGILAALQTGSRDLVDPETTPITLAISSAVTTYLSVTQENGDKSVRSWLRETYPNVRVVPSVDLNGANGGANVMYAYAETVPDSGTDDGRVWSQLVPTKFVMLGTERGAKHYTEDFSNALGGVMLKRPYAVQRRTGI